MHKIIFIVALLLSVSTGALAYDAESSCVKCHGNEARISKLGYPQLYLDPAVVDKEVAMGGISCVSCHLGDNTKMDADAAHADMPRPFYSAVGKTKKYEAVGRDIVNYDPIQPKGTDRTKLLTRKPDPAKAKAEGVKVINELFYHDHDPETMAYDPSVAMQTCGQCHTKEVEDYNKTGMGLNKYQRGYTSWTDDPPGPQNCGPWFRDNYEKIKEDCSRGDEYTEKQALSLNRACSRCHASCNDCHYEGFKKSEARHRFVKNPEPLSCYGSGKGTICHAGPMDRRRGAGFMREEFAFPVNELHGDAHNEAGLSCNDCHKFEDHTYGHLGSTSARESCQTCHTEIYDAVKTGAHDSVDCTSCHIQEVGAYQFTFWGPGVAAGMPNLYTKHKEYYGSRSLPTIVKHPETGLWIPLKPYPMGALNIAKKMGKTGLKVRTIDKTTVAGITRIGQPEEFIVERKADDVNDMYIIAGTKKGIGDNDMMLAWIQMDKMSHAIGTGRSCESCHASHEQRATSWYTYANGKDVDEPFSGSYTIIADKKGIRFENFTNTGIKPAKGRKVEDFAPFVIDENAWNVTGIDLEMKFSDTKYAEGKSEYLALKGVLHHKINAATDAGVKARLETIRAVLHHNPAAAERMLNEMQQ